MTRRLPRPVVNRRPRVDRVLVRYAALQVPGWILAVLLLILLRQWMAVSGWAIAGVLALLLVKDIAIYPFVRSAYATDGRHGTEQLIGLHGVTTGPIAPTGYVRIRGELWRAEALESRLVIPEGCRVRIESARGLTLVVTEAPHREAAAPPSSCTPTAGSSRPR